MGGIPGKWRVRRRDYALGRCQTAALAGGYDRYAGRHGCKIMAKVWNLFDKQGADVV